MTHDTTHFEIDMGQELELTSLRKDKKTCFRQTTFRINYISPHKLQMVFMQLDFEVDEPKLN